MSGPSYLWDHPQQRLPHQQASSQSQLQLEHHYDPINGNYDTSQHNGQRQAQPQQPQSSNQNPNTSFGFHYPTSIPNFDFPNGTYPPPQQVASPESIFGINYIPPAQQNNGTAAPFTFPQQGHLPMPSGSSSIDQNYPSHPGVGFDHPSLDTISTHRYQVKKRSRGSDYGDPDGESDGDQDVQHDEGSPTDDPKPKAPGACSRCKSLKVKCEFKTDPHVCRRCLNGGHQCSIPGRKKRRAPPKREHLLNEIRAQAARIEELMKQLEAANKRAAKVNGQYTGGDATGVFKSPEIGGASLLLSSETDIASPTTEEPKPDVQAWIAQARESIQAFGGIIGDASSAQLFENNSNPEDGSSELEEDYDEDDIVNVAVVDEEEGGSPGGQSSHGGNTHSREGSAPLNGKERKTSNPTNNVAHSEAIPLGLIEKMHRLKTGRKSPTPSVGAGDDDDGFGAAAPDYFNARRETIPDPTHLAPAHQQPPHILTRGIVTPQEVEELFRIYFDYMNHSVSLLDPVLYTAQNTYWRSPFLFTVICAIASRFYSARPNLYEQLIHYAQLAAGTALISGPKNVEVVAAYLLLSMYPVPVRRWEEDRTWLYVGVAIRFATDLNLNRPATTKPRNERQARELLNRTRVWINCHNLDRSTASWHGKAPTINNADYIAVHSDQWYNSSEFNVSDFDIHLAAYNAELRILAGFRQRVYSDPHHPMGMNKHLDISKIASETAEDISTLGKQWSKRLDEETDPNIPASRFRNCLIRLAYSYARMLVLSFGFQHAFGKNHQDEDVLFQQCHRAACDVVRVFVDDLSTQMIFLRHGAEAQCVFVSFAASFLVKLLHPKYANHLTMEQRIEIHTLVQNLSGLLGSPEVVNDDRHGPKLWSKFLEGLLATPMARVDLSPSAMKGTTALPRRTSKKSTRPGSASSQTEPPREAPSENPSPASSFPFTSPSQTSATMTPPQHSPELGYGDYSGQNMIGMNVPGFFQPLLAFDNDFMQSMQSMADPSTWQNVTPGFDWMGAMQNLDTDHDMGSINPGLLNVGHTTY